MNELFDVKEELVESKKQFQNIMENDNNGSDSAKSILQQYMNKISVN